MNKTLRIFNAEGTQVEYLSERLGNYPTNEKDIVSSLPADYGYLIKKGAEVIEQKKCKAEIVEVPVADKKGKK